MKSSVFWEWVFKTRNWSDSNLCAWKYTSMGWCPIYQVRNIVGKLRSWTKMDYYYLALIAELGRIRDWFSWPHCFYLTPIFVLESTLQRDDAQFIKCEILLENYVLG